LQYKKIFGIVYDFNNIEPFNSLGFSILMKRYSLFTILVLAVFLTFNSSAPENGNKDKVIAGVILHTLEVGHYLQKDIDDSFSKKAFGLFLKTLDYNKRFFTAQDVKKLKKYELQLDDEFKAGNYDMMKAGFTLLDKRAEEAKELTKEILSKPFDFKVEETLETDPEKTNFPENKKELEDSWRKYLKFQTLVHLNTLMEQQEKGDTVKDVKVKTFAEMEADARKKVQKSQDNWFERMSQLNETDKISIYINSLLSVYDPHTNYFPPRAKENFDIQLSGQLEGIGATLAEKDGFIKVEKIVPGSASWKEGQLKAGDVILKVAQGKEEPVDITNMRLGDAVQLIRGKKGTEVRLTVKKIDGTIMVIPIIRDVVVLEATYAKSALIKNKENEVGYIKLPQFYADFTNSGGRSCAIDVEKEIKKLKNENIDGLIIDLRNNGGGSLKDVVDMAGLFIEKGPIVQVRSSDGSKEVLEDHDPDIQYKGPLVILVNELSASASEILAAAMQDYNRAIIIGGGSTYGKGTVQRMVDLDRLIPSSYDALKPLGAMKLTTQKFYRINGGATQLKGVIPDLVLPDEYAFLDIGEKELDYPMKWDEIKPVFYKEWELATPISVIKADSKARIDTSNVFKSIKEKAIRLKKNADESIVSLNLDTYRAKQDTLHKEREKYDNLFSPIPGLEAYALSTEKIEMAKDTARAARDKEWFKDMDKDVYLYEATQVINDLQKK